MAVKTCISLFFKYFLISWLALVHHESWYGTIGTSFAYTIDVVPPYIVYQGEMDKLAHEPILTSRINFISVGGAAK